MKLASKIIVGMVYLGVCCFVFCGTLFYLARTESHIPIEVSLSDARKDVDKFKRLHKFHGTNYSYYERGKWWFERSGRKCELWDPKDRR